MNFKKTSSFLFVFVIFLMSGTLSLQGSTLESDTSIACSAESSPRTAIHFLGFDWEHAFILESQGRFALIDGGFSGRAYYLADYLKRLAGTDTVELDFIIGTHPHGNHVSVFTGRSGQRGNHTPLIGSDLGITAKRAYFREHRGIDVPSLFTSLYNVFKDNDIPVVIDNDVLKNHVIQFGDMKITLMFGGTGLPNNSSAFINRQSMAQFIEIGDFRVLLASDLCRNDGDFLAANIREVTGDDCVRIDVFKIGHHSIHGTGVDSYMAQLNPTTAISSNTADELTTPYYLEQELNRPARSNALRILRRDTNAQIFTQYDAGGILVVFGEDGYEVSAIGERPLCPHRYGGTRDHTFEPVPKVLTNLF